MRCRLDDAERTILLAEERLHEHNIIDENLSAMLAKVKLHSDAELRRFKEEAEISYHNGVSTKKSFNVNFYITYISLSGLMYLFRTNNTLPLC